MALQPLNLKKQITYAYPTSTTATKLGYGELGCWFVEMANEASTKTIKEGPAFTSKAEAIKHAETIANEWHPLYANLYDVHDGHREYTYEEKKARREALIAANVWRQRASLEGTMFTVEQCDGDEMKISIARTNHKGTVTDTLQPMNLQELRALEQVISLAICRLKS